MAETKAVWNEEDIKVREDNRVGIGNDEKDLTPDIQNNISSRKINLSNASDDVVLIFVHNLWTNHSAPGKIIRIEKSQCELKMLHRYSKIMRRKL